MALITSPRYRALALLLLLPWLAVSAGGESVGRQLRLSDQVHDGERFMQLRLLGALELSGHPLLMELSALAWDQDEERLYAISDRGVLLHLQPLFDAGKLMDLLLLEQYPLLDQQQQRLHGEWRDAEGLTLIGGSNGKPGDSQLLISFERQQRIVRYSPRGRFLAATKLPAPLDDPRFYGTPNKGLEAVALHPTLGLMSGPERMAENAPIPIFDHAGNRWLYHPREPLGSLVAMEALGDGSMILLERAVRSPFLPWVISLVQVNPTLVNRDQPLRVRVLARFDSSEGWRLHNMEGLSRYRDRRFFMVSDNGGSGLLQTQLVHFELVLE